MKRITFGIFALLSLALVGCQADVTTDNIAKEGATTFTVHTAGTRTYLGGKVGDTYPVFWSDGDKIVVNGVESEAAVINAEDASVAQFTINTSVKYPYNITYPYTSACKAGAAAVLFPAEQNYIEGSFEQKCAPMCGYATSSSESITMKHLTTILRIPIKAQKEGVVLDKVVITSTSGAKLAGEFSVNCTSGALTASGEATNVVTYTLPSNFTISTTSDKVLHITLPAVDAGMCRVEIFNSNGERMTNTWNGSKLKAGIVREFKSIVFRPGVSAALAPLEVEIDELDIQYPTVFGYVKDTNGNPIKGVAVSDGFSVVATDEKGYYTLNVSRDCWYIYISLPSEYEVPINEYGQPCFYQKYPSNSPQYDFTLKPLPNGKEKKFALVTFGDPQVSSASKLNRFLKEAVPGIKAHITELSKSVPCYGITLGDIISNSNSTNSGAYRDDMRDGFAKSSVGLPVFQVMGNHDNTHFNSSKPVYADERNSTFELKAQREHEDMFGPVNYSFNRGDVHIIGMRDIVYTTNLSSSNYALGFLDSQWEWLKQDLALVPKDKVVVLCVHIPFYNKNSHYTQDVLKLLNTYDEAHIMSGHTHIIQTYSHRLYGTGYNNVYEHNVGAVCGCWWSSNMCSDGSPNGFGVFIGEGNTLSDWYYTGYHTGMNSRAHQMRLYRGNAVTGGAISGTNTYGTKGYYAFGFGEDYLLANVYFSDAEWTIKVYEDGVYTGNMTPVAYVSRPKISAMSGDGSLASPFTPLTETSADMYFTGLRLGIQGTSETGTGNGNSCRHMYKYKLKNKNASIKVEAIDTFGNVYTETKITEGTDYSLTK